MNIKQIYHFQAAQHDHHYLKLPFAEHWVDEAVKVTLRISLNIVQGVCSSTQI